ncbi:MAG: TolC family protein, partial [Bacteroidota bacterium]
AFKLGTFLNRKHEIENAELKKLIAEQDINQEKLAIRSEVLQRYQEYLLSIEVLTTRSLAEENAYEAYKLLSEQFKVGKADLEDFTNASSAYFSATEARQLAQTDVKLTQIKVEEMIGISLDKAKRLGPKEDK